jgi:hypothetical protein
VSPPLALLDGTCGNIGGKFLYVNKYLLPIERKYARQNCWMFCYKKKLSHAILNWIAHTSDHYACQVLDTECLEEEKHTKAKKKEIR